jgi:CHASE2 domain-containing sensor protein
VLLGGRLLIFLVAYCLLFTLLAGADILTWKRTLVGYEEEVPRNWLGFLLPPRLADWRYWLAPPAPPAPDLLVVTLPSFAGRTREEVRRELAALIRQATQAPHKARGVALDIFFDQHRPAPLVDPILCREVEAAQAAGVPVLVGYRHEERGGVILRLPPPPTLEACLPVARQGHLASFLEPDDRVRMVPLFLAGDRKLPSLSWQAAQALAGAEPSAPAGGLLQFLPPRGGVAHLDGLPRGEDLDLFRDHFIFVGSGSERDRYRTPFGELQGVAIHALAAHGLRSGAFVRRLHPAWTFPSLFAFCYLLAVALARRGGRRRLLALAGGLSLAIVAVAAVAMAAGRLWIDVSYPLVAIWGLVGLLVVPAGRLARSARSAPSAGRQPPAGATPATTPAAATAEAGFDVFLSHNSQDKPAVRELADLLVARGLRPWLDERELVPGRPWQEALEEVIQAARTAAVLVGRDGLGPWEEVEMRACLSQFVDRRKPVIPVLMPGAPARPDLPLFLTQFTWVDLRSGLATEGLDRLVWGITGQKPRG